MFHIVKRTSRAKRVQATEQASDVLPALAEASSELGVTEFNLLEVRLSLYPVGVVPRTPRPARTPHTPTLTGGFRPKLRLPKSAMGLVRLKTGSEEGARLWEGFAHIQYACALPNHPVPDPADDPARPDGAAGSPSGRQAAPDG